MYVYLRQGYTRKYMYCSVLLNIGQSNIKFNLYWLIDFSRYTIPKYMIFYIQIENIENY